MHGASYPVTDKFTHYAEPIYFDASLNCARDVDNAIPDSCTGNSFIQRFSRHINQFLRQQATTAYGNRFCGVADEALISYTNIEADNIAELDSTGSGNTMNNLVVY